jgi:hypothetical protein
MGEAALLSVAVKTQQVRLMDVFLLGRTNNGILSR